MDGRKRGDRKDLKLTDLRVEKKKQMSISYRGSKKYPDGYTFVLCRKKLGLSNAINSIKQCMKAVLRGPQEI